MKAWYNFFRFVLIFCNVILAVLGLLMMAGGIWSGLEKHKVDDEIMDTSEEKKEISKTKFGEESFQFFVIVVGALIFLVALIGFVGAENESTCVLLTYNIFLIFIIILQVIAIIIINVEKSWTDNLQWMKSVLISHRTLLTSFFGTAIGLTFFFLSSSIFVGQLIDRCESNHQKEFPT